MGERRKEKIAGSETNVSMVLLSKIHKDITEYFFQNVIVCLLWACMFVPRIQYDKPY